MYGLPICGCVVLGTVRFCSILLLSMVTSEFAGFLRFALKGQGQNCHLQLYTAGGNLYWWTQDQYFATCPGMPNGSDRKWGKNYIHRWAEHEE